MKRKMMRKSGYKFWFLGATLLGLLAFVCGDVLAGSMSVGDVASSITDSFKNIAKLITGGSYLAGLGFSIAAIMKFKSHKDQPTQISVGTPIALVFIAAALLFLPTILGVTGKTMFKTETPTTAGPGGTIFK